MNCLRKTSVFAWLTVLAICPLCSKALAVSVYSFGHSDIALLHEAGSNEFDFVFRFDSNAIFEDGNSTFQSSNIDVSEAAIRVPEPTLLRPDTAPFNTSVWDFLGVDPVPPDDTSGDGELWFISQGNDPARPFMGIATETLNPSTQWSSDLTYSLLEIQEAPTGGNVSMWQADSNGNPTPFFSSVDGIDETDALVDSINGHDHFNWGFSEPGVYRLLIQASAVHVDDGLVESAATLTFVVGGDTVLPEPQPGDFNGDGFVNAADYTVWRDNLGAPEDGLLLNGNGDGGTVGTSDYELWRGLFGTDYTSSSAAATATPEPSTLFLIAIAHTGLLGIARCRRGCL